MERCLLIANHSNKLWFPTITFYTLRSFPTIRTSRNNQRVNIALEAQLRLVIRNRPILTWPIPLIDRRTLDVPLSRIKTSFAQHCVRVVQANSDLRAGHDFGFAMLDFDSRSERSISLG